MAWTPLGWSSFYATDLSGRAFEALYTDQGPMHWATQIQLLWANVADRFANHSGVLAYELFNEPWAGKRGSVILRSRHGSPHTSLLLPPVQELSV